MADIVDIHPHVISDDCESYPLAPVGGTLSGWASTRPVTAERLLADMDAAGITKAALVQASTAYGYDNRYVLDSAMRHPDRFVAIGCVDPLAADAPSVVRSLADTSGCAGIRLFTTGSTMPGQAGWLNDMATFPFWAAVEETNIPVCVQMKLAVADQLLDILTRFPAAPVVLDHMAYPPIEPGREREAFEAIAVFAAHPQLVLKFTVRNTEPLSHGDADAFVKPLIAAFGADHIAWGSNYPAAEQPLDQLVELANHALATVSDEDRDHIFSRTAVRLYPQLS